MEIYSTEQYERILNNCEKTIIVEVIDSNDETQNKLHSEINRLVLDKYYKNITFLKINVNLIDNLFNNIDKFPKYLIYKKSEKTYIDVEIHNSSDFINLANKIERNNYGN